MTKKFPSPIRSSENHSPTGQKILIIKHSAFGDIIQSLGAIQDIRLHHPVDKITVMTTPSYEQYFRRCPWTDSVIIDPRGPRWRLDKMHELRKKIAELNPDLIYDLQQVGRTRFYRQLLLKNFHWAGPLPPQEETRCAMERLAFFLEQAGVPVIHTLQPDPGWMAEGVHLPARVADRLSSPYIVLIPGASKGHSKKRWPYYDQLAAWLRNKSFKVVTVPGPQEMELCRSFQHAEMLADGERFLDPFELAAILQKSSFIIGNDTGPAHLGAHLGIPGLALFSGHLPPELTGIQYSKFSHIEHPDLQQLSLDHVTGHLETHHRI